MMPLYQFERDQVVRRKIDGFIFLKQDDLEAELLDSPEEREPVGSSKNRRDFGTCQVPSRVTSDRSFLYMLHYGWGRPSPHGTIFNRNGWMDQEIHPTGQGRIDSVKINPSLLRMRGD